MPFEYLCACIPWKHKSRSVCAEAMRVQYCTIYKMRKHWLKIWLPSSTLWNILIGYIVSDVTIRETPKRYCMVKLFSHIVSSCTNPFEFRKVFNTEHIIRLCSDCFTCQSIVSVNLETDFVFLRDLLLVVQWLLQSSTCNDTISSASAKGGLLIVSNSQ